MRPRETERQQRADVRLQQVRGRGKHGKVVGGLRPQGISTRGLLRVTGSVKSVKLPSPKEATPLGEVPCCGKLLKLSLESSVGNCGARSRLIAEPARRSAEDWVICRRLPKCDVAASGSVSTIGKVWVTDEGLTSPRLLKGRSGPRGDSWG